MHAAQAAAAAHPWHLAASAALAAATLTWWVTGRLTGWLARRELGKAIRRDGPAHQGKAGTPTMGGLAMLGTIIALAVSLRPLVGGSGALLVAGGALAFGVLGLVDDVSGLARRSAARELGVGLSARRMFALQAVTALALAGLWAWAGPGPDGAWLLTLTLAAHVVVILGTVNGVNLTDGLDGLAAGACCLAFGTLALLLLLGWAPGAGPAPHFGPDVLGPAAMAAGTAGGCLGFLVHNRHPARVIMGNVGSMALGACLALLAVVTGLWWLLPVVGAVFVIEVLSVVAQVGYFKWSGGRRILRMAPLHHHFEAGGRSETEIVRGFWVAGVVASVAGLVLASQLGG